MSTHPSNPEWIGHEWKPRGFYSDECIHCGRIAVGGMNSPDGEHCPARAAKQHQAEPMHPRMKRRVLWYRIRAAIKRWSIFT